MNEELKQEILKLADAGDAKALREYMVDHFEEFDEEDRETLMLGAFAEEAGKQADEADLEELQEDALEAAYKIKALADVLEMKIKAKEAAGETQN